MPTKEHAERLARAIERSGLAEPVISQFGENRVNVLCRVQESNERAWTEMVKNILLSTEAEASEPHAWQTHVCKNYFIKEMPGGEKKIVWGWNLAISSPNMSMSLDAVAGILAGKPIRIKKQGGEFTEFPLSGAPPNRNAPGPNGKGVHTIGDKPFSPVRK